MTMKMTPTMKKARFTMTTPSDAAAERSAHVERGEAHMLDMRPAVSPFVILNPGEPGEATQLRVVADLAAARLEIAELRADLALAREQLATWRSAI